MDRKYGRYGRKNVHNVQGVHVHVASQQRDSAERKANIAQVNDRFKWTTEQIGSLYRTIAKYGTVTEQDSERIALLHGELGDIESHLADGDKKVAGEQIQKAYGELHHIDTLRQQLPLYRAAEAKLPDVVNNLLGASQELSQVYHSIDRSLLEAVDAPPVYGSDEWQALMEAASSGGSIKDPEVAESLLRFYKEHS